MQADRNLARACAPNRFREIFVDADLATCEARDPKGLYRKARAGEIANFTGITAPYEAPTQPDFIVSTAHEGVDISVDRLLEYVVGETAI